MRSAGLRARWLLLAVGLIGAALSAAAVIHPAFGVAGAVIAAAVLVAQHSLAGPVVFPFTVEDWKQRGDDWIIEIPRSQHGRRSPTATVWRGQDDGTMAKIYLEARVKSDHTIVLCIAKPGPFAGEVRVN